MKKTLIILMMVLLAAVLIVSCEDNKNDLNKKKYKVGDTGPAGGIIFYVNPKAKADKWTYLEVGKSDISDSSHSSTQGSDYFKWRPTVVDCGTGEKIGDGLNNTKKLSEKGSDYQAAYAVYGKDLYGNKYKDWFIPSKEEFNLLYESLKDGKLEPSLFSLEAFYWSSSEGGDSSAFKMGLSTGTLGEDSRTTECKVRPVRRF